MNSFGRSGLVLADDATGALECASLLATMGVAVTMTFEPGPSSDVLVADMETRHLSAAEAGARVGRWAAQAPGSIFKKTDSTLRGNIAAELLALLPRGPVVYLPAYPALERTVRRGQLLVRGVPVDETDFAFDPRHPVKTSVIADLFPAGVTESIGSAVELREALRGKARILICDAETDGDVDALAGELRGHEVTLAGPGGMVRVWADLHAFPLRAARDLPQISDWLIVCGSLHPQSRRQAEWAAGRGFAVLASPSEPGGSAERVAEELARRAAGRIERQRTQGIVIMGGDTAFALWRALGIDTLEPWPEVLPGVAACRWRNLVFVTKAGGFGDEELVQKVKEKFA